MCGKFTQMASWAEIVAFSRALSEPPRPVADSGGGGEGGGGAGEDGNDASIVATPMRFASIMRLDPKGEREMVPMRWGFSKPGATSPARPDYMHARAETVDVRPAFAASFRERRGLCFVRTFNEGEEIGSRTRQWTVTPKDAGAVDLFAEPPDGYFAETKRDAGGAFRLTLVETPKDAPLAATPVRLTLATASGAMEFAVRLDGTRASP